MLQLLEWAGPSASEAPAAQSGMARAGWCAGPRLVEGVGEDVRGCEHLLGVGGASGLEFPGCQAGVRGLMLAWPEASWGGGACSG